MKVLWFSNTPANATQFLKDGLVSGGWLKSLDIALAAKIELHIAFYYPKRNDSFKYLNTTYHPIGRKNWKLKALTGIFWEKLIDQQDLPKYLKIINLVEPDIIHIHGTENPFSCIIPNTNIPVVVSIQGCVTVINHKFCSGFTKSNLLVSYLNFGKSIWQYIQQKSFIRIWKQQKEMKVIEQHNLKNAKYLIGRTAWDKRITSVLAPHSIYYHCDELLRNAFYGQIWESHKREKLIIHTTTGNSPFKGFETICEALFELNCIPDIKVEWQIAGIRADDSIVKVTRNKLKKRFPKTGLLYLGVLDENELIKKLCNADIYVFPSHIENSPNSLCEAMLIGMPCIATLAGGTGSLLKDGDEGILIQDGDPWSMAGAIIELHKNQVIAKEYGINARRRALIRHDKEKIVSDLINIYLSIINKHFSSH
jgi:glycosyltransferase involved in cell wall biosynthesis